MRDSFVFYRSFFAAICKLDDKKRLKMYDLIANFALNEEEIDTKFEICEQLFTLIKPQLLASNKRFEDGKKGGRPKKIKNHSFENEKSNNNVNDNVNVNVNNNVNDNDLVFCEENFEPIKKKKIDPFTNPLIDKCFDIYKQRCPNLLKLGFEPRNVKIREQLSEFLNEIDSDIGYFEKLCEKANKLKEIVHKTIDFKSLITNHIGIYNGKYKDNDTFDYMDYLREQNSNESG